MIATNAGAIGTLNIGAGAAMRRLHPARSLRRASHLALAPVRSTSIIRPPTTCLRPRSAATGTVNVLAGTTTLTGANSYSGATNVNAGTLRAGAPNTFSPNSAVTVASGGTLDLNGFSQTVPGVTNAGLVNMGIGHCAGHGLDDDQLHGSWRNDRDEHLFGGLTVRRRTSLSSTAARRPA